MKSNHIILIVVLIIVVGAIGFYAGIKYQQNQRPAGFAAGRGAGQFRQFGAGQAGGNTNTQAVRGQILSVSGNTMTIKLPDGSSKIVVLPSNVNISKQTAGSASDLKTGSEVMIFGTSNSDGSVTAQMVSLNPIFRGSRGVGNNIQVSPSQ